QYGRRSWRGHRRERPYAIEELVSLQRHHGCRRLMARSWHEMELLLRRANRVEVCLHPFPGRSQVLFPMNDEDRDLEVRQRRNVGRHQWARQCRAEEMVG